MNLEQYAAQLDADKLHDIQDMMLDALNTQMTPAQMLMLITDSLFGYDSPQAKQVADRIEADKPDSSQQPHNGPVSRSDALDGKL